MAYYKPQSPLIMNGKSIYPLTTADQVMLEDGSRLDAKYITTNIIKSQHPDKIYFKKREPSCNLAKSVVK